MKLKRRPVKPAGTLASRLKCMADLMNGDGAEGREKLRSATNKKTVRNRETPHPT
jgi:hypothetical protein